MASYPIAEVQAIAPFYKSKLKAAGIRSTTTLLKHAATPKLRKELAQSTNIPMRLILDWANIADLTRVRGVALDYAELLFSVGVNTVKDLGRRNATTLVARMAKLNGEKRRVSVLPSQARVERWIEAAQSLPQGMEY
jgi:hypothetical protein